MRKVSCIVLLILLLCLLTACFGGKSEEEPRVTQGLDTAAVRFEIPSLENTVPSRSSENVANIDFRYIYRGFSAVPLDDGNLMADYMGFGAKVIVNETDWNAFTASYCPGVPYYDTWDFSQECLIASIVSGARPAYANSNTITKLSWKNGCFVFAYENDPNHYLYALNSNDVTHFYVEVIAISKDNLPEGAAVWTYHP